MQHKADLLPLLAPVTEFVTLKGGLTVPVPALTLVLDLEARGFRMSEDAFESRDRAGDGSHGRRSGRPPPLAATPGGDCRVPVSRQRPSTVTINPFLPRVAEDGLSPLDSRAPAQEVR